MGAEYLCEVWELSLKELVPEKHFLSGYHP